MKKEHDNEQNKNDTVSFILLEIQVECDKNSIFFEPIILSCTLQILKWSKFFFRTYEVALIVRILSRFDS